MERGYKKGDKNKSALELFKRGKPGCLWEKQVLEIINNLYDKGLAEAWFIGMGWVEGYHYCSNPAYLKANAEAIFRRHYAAVWFACRLLE